MTWVLIIILGVGGNAISQVSGFPSETSCQAAAAKIEAHTVMVGSGGYFRDKTPTAICIAKPFS